jgi:hypothetical protein
MIFFAEFMNREVRSRINREKMKTEIEDFLLWSVFYCGEINTFSYCLCKKNLMNLLLLVIFWRITINKQIGIHNVGGVVSSYSLIVEFGSS